MRRKGAFDWGFEPAQLAVRETVEVHRCDYWPGPGIGCCGKPATWIAVYRSGLPAGYTCTEHTTVRRQSPNNREWLDQVTWRRL